MSEGEPSVAAGAAVPQALQAPHVLQVVHVLHGVQQLVAPQHEWQRWWRNASDCDSPPIKTNPSVPRNRPMPKTKLRFMTFLLLK